MQCKPTSIYSIAAILLLTGILWQPNFVIIQAAQPPQRLALVIGNSDYRFDPLKNPVNDATDIAEVLSELGFEVTLKTDADRRTMETAILDFGRRLRHGGTGLFFFAGHGIQVSGSNYLIPVKHNINTEADVRFEAVDAARVLAHMEDAGNGMNIIILDACRNNPLARSFRSTGKGLAKMDPPTGSILAYATGPGSVAFDGTGRNGLYTSMLLKHILTPGLTIEKFFKLVRRDVKISAAAMGGEQVPWELSSLLGEFTFVVPAVAVAPAVAAPSPAVSPPPAPSEGFQRLATLAEQRQEVHKRWNQWQARMLDQHAEARRLDQSPHLKPDEKERLWSAFLQEFAADNPFSDQDESLRLEASDRITALRAAPPPVPALSSAPQAPVVAAVVATPFQGGSFSGRRLKNSLGMEFVELPTGEFLMGAPGISGETPTHRVRITRPIYMQTTEVTQRQWQEVTGQNPSGRGLLDHFTHGSPNQTTAHDFFKSLMRDPAKLPIGKVSWNDCQAFVDHLNERGDGLGIYRLPTEAEWEYAARAGSPTAPLLIPDHQLRHMAWFSANSEGVSQPVGQKAANAWGLLDMLGNVAEWCQSVYGPYPDGLQVDPVGPPNGTYRIQRGGNFRADPGRCRPTARSYGLPESRDEGVGLRLVLIPVRSRRLQPDGGQPERGP